MALRLKSASAGKRPIKNVKPAVKTSATPGTKKPLKKSLSAGFAVARQANQEAQMKREEAMNRPFEFRLKVGESAQLILLGEPAFFWFHQWETSPGKYNGAEVCIKDKGSEPCPLCESLDKGSQYVMALTCIDKRSYTDRQGKEHEFSRKVLMIKQSMIPKYERILKKHGTFDGLLVSVSRDGGKTSPAAGDDVDVIKKLDVNKVRQKYGKAAELVDFEKGYPHRSAEDIRKRWRLGKANTPGDEEFASGDDFEEENWDEDEE